MAVTINASTSAGLVQSADTTGNLNIQSNGSTVVAVTSAGAAVTGTLSASGLISATAAGIAVPTSALGTCYSGTYTPTITNGTNVDGSTAFECQYMRVGNVVTVSGTVNIDPAATGTYTSIGMSLPVASNFSAAPQLGGVGCTGLAAQGVFGILADTTNDRAQFDGSFTSAPNQALRFSFTYQVI